MSEKAPGAFVRLREGPTLHAIRAIAKPNVKIELILQRAYWKAWDEGKDTVWFTIEAYQSKDGASHGFILPMSWLEILEEERDA